jgi:hypothetical protein
MTSGSWTCANAQNLAGLQCLASCVHLVELVLESTIPIGVANPGDTSACPRLSLMDVSCNTAELCAIAGGLYINFNSEGFV